MSAVHLLRPGEMVIAPRGDRIRTLLGSGVVIALTDARCSVGALAHVVIGGAPSPYAQASIAWGEPALRSLQAGLEAMGVAVRDCVASVYGGANVFPEQFDTDHLGEGNARWALAALARDGIEVAWQDLGGTDYRFVDWRIGAGVPRARALPL